MNSIAGLILAGGRSRRMGGAAKALAELGGETLMARLARLLTLQVVRLAVVLPPHLDAPLPPSAALLRDASPTFEGPLAGLLAGLDWAAALPSAVTHLATAPVDLPFLPADVVARLAAAPGDPDTIVIAEGPSGRAPLVALWPLAARPRLAAFLAGPDRRVQAFLGRERVETVTFAEILVGERSVDPFFNVNSPGDLRRAEEWQTGCRPW